MVYERGWYVSDLNKCYVCKNCGYFVLFGKEDELERHQKECWK